jgi:hypothetical protein
MAGHRAEQRLDGDGRDDALAAQRPRRTLVRCDAHHGLVAVEADRLDRGRGEDRSPQRRDLVSRAVPQIVP